MSSCVFRPISTHIRYASCVEDPLSPRRQLQVELRGSRSRGVLEAAQQPPVSMAHDGIRGGPAHVWVMVCSAVPQVEPAPDAARRGALRRCPAVDPLAVIT